jgi:hypothetical protein
MTRFFTPPDVDFDSSISKIFIRNCPWTDEQLTNLVDQLGDKRYDIYIYRNDMNDIQWAEGIRTHAKKIYDWKHYKEMQPEELLRKIDDDF